MEFDLSEEVVGGDSSDSVKQQETEEQMLAHSYDTGALPSHASSNLLGREDIKKRLLPEIYRTKYYAHGLLPLNKFKCE